MFHINRSKHSSVPSSNHSNDYTSRCIQQTLIITMLDIWIYCLLRLFFNIPGMIRTVKKHLISHSLVIWMLSSYTNSILIKKVYCMYKTTQKNEKEMVHIGRRQYTQRDTSLFLADQIFFFLFLSSCAVLWQSQGHVFYR